MSIFDREKCLNLLFNTHDYFSSVVISLYGQWLYIYLITSECSDLIYAYHTLTGTFPIYLSLLL